MFDNIKEGFTIWEFTKFVIGPFVGAFVAFLSNDILHRRRKQEEEIALIQSAWFAIGAMYDDFHNYRFYVRQQADTNERRYRAWPNDPAPIWAFSRPLLFEFRDSGLPDLSALKFLLDRHEGQIAFQHLQYLDRSYRLLSLTHRMQNEAAVTLQEKMEEHERDTWPDTERAIGRRAATAARDFVIAQFQAILDDEKYYIFARDSLRKAAEKRYGNNISLVEFETKKEFANENLPPIPPVIAAKIQEIEAGRET